MFSQVYPKQYPSKLPEINHDPGRIRNTEFFKNMYGSTKGEVEENLTNVVWLPEIDGSILRVTKINGIDKKIKAISDEFLPKKHLHEYLVNPGGTFNWRKIAKTDRLSAHSFGIAIDINVSKSDYWAWHKETPTTLPENKPPQEIVEIFEKHGFIWGGKWYHYDTMHFEYRPELLK